MNPTSQTQKRRAEVISFDDIPAVPCPCGEARRAFADVAEYPGTVHRTDITADARTHYHKRLTEVYYVLECEPDAAIELDGERVPLQSGSCVLIPPLVRHRAIGPMRVLVIVQPKFDPADEWFD
jgi:mannose-6-phosphate isomerase-like protein (cupin superfamily)